MIRSGFGNWEARWLQRLSMCRIDGQLVCIDVGLHAAGLQALYLPSLKNKERACIQWQRHGWFNGWGHLICVKQGPGTTPLCVWQMVGRTWPRSLLLGGGVSNYKGNWWLMSAWLVGYQENQQTSTLWRSLPLTTPSINYHGEDILIWNLEKSLAEVRGNYVGI